MYSLTKECIQIPFKDYMSRLSFSVSLTANGHYRNGLTSLCFSFPIYTCGDNGGFLCMSFAFRHKIYLPKLRG